MSRSIHSTRKELREMRLRSYRDDKIKAAEVAELEKELDRKRRIKGIVSGSRGTDNVESSAGMAGPISIRVLNTGPHIVHAATPADIEAIRQRLPAGVMAGLAEIVFSLGEHAQLEWEDAGLWDPDPITGRIGLEILPGFYKGWIWGSYQSSACRITLHAFVSDPEKFSPMPTAAYFKLQILSTFVHEVAHHFDHTQRIARGRWRADDNEKAEHFADHRQYEWTHFCVVPYLEETYPGDVTALLDWLASHGKVRFSLGELTTDRRQIQLWTVEQAVEELLKDVLQETEHLETLRNFAVNLKIADMYDRAQEVIDHILLEAPDDEDALELRANIWNFQNKYDQAAHLAIHVLERNPRNWLARNTLTGAYEGLEQWENVVETTTESLTLFDEEVDRLDAIARRCSAYWKLGKKEESDKDLRILQGSKRASLKVRRILRDRNQPEQLVSASRPS